MTVLLYSHLSIFSAALSQLSYRGSVGLHIGSLISENREAFCIDRRTGVSLVYKQSICPRSNLYDVTAMKKVGFFLSDFFMSPADLTRKTYRRAFQHAETQMDARECLRGLTLVFKFYKRVGRGEVRGGAGELSQFS